MISSYAVDYVGGLNIQGYEARNRDRDTELALDAAHDEVHVDAAVLHVQFGLSGLKLLQFLVDLISQWAFYWEQMLSRRSEKKSAAARLGAVT